MTDNETESNYGLEGLPLYPMQISYLEVKIFGSFIWKYKTIVTESYKL